MLKDWSKTIELKQFQQFAEEFAKVNAVENAIMIHAFLLTAPYTNFTVKFYLPEDRWERLRNELSEYVHTGYKKSEKTILLEHCEIMYEFEKC